MPGRREEIDVISFYVIIVGRFIARQVSDGMGVLHAKPQLDSQLFNLLAIAGISGIDVFGIFETVAAVDIPDQLPIDHLVETERYYPW